MIHIQTSPVVELEQRNPTELIATPRGDRKVLLKSYSVVEQNVAYEIHEEVQVEEISEEVGMEVCENEGVEGLDETTGEMSEESKLGVEVSEISTRRLTENGEIRYFCPQCNVRYTKCVYDEKLKLSEHKLSFFFFTFIGTSIWRFICVIAAKSLFVSIALQSLNNVALMWLTSKQNTS